MERNFPDRSLDAVADNGYETLCSVWCLRCVPRGAKRWPHLYLPILSSRRGFLYDLECDECDTVILPARSPD
jgi:hypothetical protein